jgi:hypothetical protein
MSDPPNSPWKTRLVEGKFPNRDFDVEFWQEQGDEAIFAAAWEMVELTQIKSGGSLSLQRSVTNLRRSSG